MSFFYSITVFLSVLQELEKLLVKFGVAPLLDPVKKTSAKEIKEVEVEEVEVAVA
jgi:hypothetical protein